MSSGILACVSLASIPLLLRALGPELFAAYVLILSLANWLVLGDAGLGNSLINFVSEARSRGESPRRFEGAAAILAVALLFGGVCVLFAASGVASRFLFVNLPGVGADGPVLLFAGASLLLAAALGSVGYKAWYGRQQGYWANAINAAGYLAGFAALWWTVRLGPDNTALWCLVAFTLPQALGGLLALALALGRPTVAAFRAGEIRAAIGPLLRRARGFFLFGLMAAAVLNIDYIVISQALPAEQIAAYGIVTRVFNAGLALFAGLLSATWPTFTEWTSHGRWDEVFNLARKYIWFGVTCLAAGVCLLVLVLPILLPMLAPNQIITIQSHTIFLAGVYYAIRIWSDTYAMVVMSTSDLRVFWKWVPIQAAFSMGTQVVLVPLIGIDGAFVGLIVSFLASVAWVLPLRVREMSHAESLKGGQYEC